MQDAIRLAQWKASGQIQLGAGTTQVGTNAVKENPKGL